MRGLFRMHQATRLTELRASRVIDHVRLLLIAVLVLSACTDTAPTSLRYPLLEDSGSSDWKQVTVGSDHTCALKTNGQAFCWGANQYGQLGVSHTDTTCGTSDKNRIACSLVPVPVSTSVRFTSIVAGANHTCGIADTRDAYCWGSNTQGQLSIIGAGGSALVHVSGSLGWTQISAGSTHTCAVRTDGQLFCWGANDRGQIGTGSGSGPALPTRVQLQPAVASVSTGDARTCARTTTGATFCWGAIWLYRQSGLEYTRSQLTPQAVPSAPSFAMIAVGTLTTCAADATGFAYCWEANTRGEMGTGSTDGSTSPQRVHSDLEFIQLSAGIVHTCGIVRGGVAYCWGDDSFGQLGLSPGLLAERCDSQQLPCSTLPIAVFGRQAFTSIAAGFGSHVCGVTDKGNLYCWGLGVSGQRGDRTAGLAVTIPIKVAEP